MSKSSIDEILKNFNPSAPACESDLKGGTVTIWLPREYKAKYARIQEKSGRRFIKALREIVQAALDQVDQAS